METSTKLDTLLQKKVLKTVHQKYIKISAREGHAPSVWTRAHVQGLKEPRLAIRGDQDQGLFSIEEDKTSPHRLVSQSTMLQERYVQGRRSSNMRRIVLSMITGPYSRRRRRLTITVKKLSCQSWYCLNKQSLFKSKNFLKFLSN